MKSFVVEEFDPNLQTGALTEIACILPKAAIALGNLQIS